jgi:hypothetical protein
MNALAAPNHGGCAHGELSGSRTAGTADDWTAATDSVTGGVALDSTTGGSNVGGWYVLTEKRV